VHLDFQRVHEGKYNAEHAHSAYLIGQKVSNTSAAKFPVHEASEKAEQSLLTLIFTDL
jgi:hypothetical protein